MRAHNIPSCYRKSKKILIKPPDLALLPTLIGSNYLCLELIFMVPKVFEPVKFDCIYSLYIVSLTLISQSTVLYVPQVASNFVWKQFCLYQTTDISE